MTNTPARRSMISAIGAAGAALVLGSKAAQAQNPPASSGRFQPSRHAEDEWLDASGVLAVTRAQEVGYTLLSAG